jgi:hypothetical protein
MNYCTYFLFVTRQNFGEDDTHLIRLAPLPAESVQPDALEVVGHRLIYFLHVLLEPEGLPPQEREGDGGEGAQGDGQTSAGDAQDDDSGFHSRTPYFGLTKPLYKLDYVQKTRRNPAIVFRNWGFCQSL